MTTGTEQCRDCGGDGRVYGEAGVTIAEWDGRGESLTCDTCSGMGVTAAICERCGKRTGSAWNGEGGWNWLCGPCKIKYSLGGGRGRRLGAELSVGATAICGQPVSVEFVIDDDELGEEKN